MLADGLELFVPRHLWVDAVQLPEIDPLDAEIGAALFGLFNEIVGAAVWYPPVRTGTCQAPFGGDNEPLIWMQRLSDQPLGHIRAVGVGGIDEVHAELRYARQRA